MNGLWNRYVSSNLRLLVYNNNGGQTFHWNCSRGYSNLEQHISASHSTSIHGWVTSLGFKYFCASDIKQFDEVFPEFLSPDSKGPICLEIFTEKEHDAQVLHDYYEICRNSIKSIN